MLDLTQLFLSYRDRPPSKQFPEIQALGDAAFDFQFEVGMKEMKILGQYKKSNFISKPIRVLMCCRPVIWALIGWYNFFRLCYMEE